MLLRVLLLSVFVSVISLNQGFAMNDPVGDQGNHSHTIVTPASTLVSPERPFFGPIREEMALLKFASSKVSSPEVRKVYKKYDTGQFFSVISLKGQSIFIADQLFDPKAKVYSSQRGWETNQKRMEHGEAPIGHQGIVSKEDRKSLSIREILKRQKSYRIELQHVMQTEKGPICEMTHKYHMGRDMRFAVGESPKSKKPKIFQKDLTKSEARRHLASHPTHKVESNVLHFRHGRSRINRNRFAELKKKHWITRAKAIKKRTQTSKTSVRKKLFD